jgi:hypothetical protein
VVVSTRTIDEAGEIVEIIPESDIVFDQVRLTFSGNAQHNLMHHLNWYCRQSFLQYWKRCHWHANE